MERGFRYEIGLKLINHLCYSLGYVTYRKCNLSKNSQNKYENVDQDMLLPLQLLCKIPFYDVCSIN